MTEKEAIPSNEQLSRLARSNEYLGKDRDQLREIILDRDEEIERLSVENTELRRCLDGGVDCAKEKLRLRAALKSLPVETSPERPVRFDLSRDDYDDWSMCPDGSGDYVRWEDVKQFFEKSAVETAGSQEIRKLYNTNVKDLNEELCRDGGHVFPKIPVKECIRCHAQFEASPEEPSAPLPSELEQLRRIDKAARTYVENRTHGSYSKLCDALFSAIAPECKCKPVDTSTLPHLPKMVVADDNCPLHAVKAPGRPLTEPERGALNRAADKSCKVVDPGIDATQENGNGKQT